MVLGEGMLMDGCRVGVRHGGGDPRTGGEAQGRGRRDYWNLVGSFGQEQLVNISAFQPFWSPLAPFVYRQLVQVLFLFRGIVFSPAFLGMEPATTPQFNPTQPTPPRHRHGTGRAKGM